MASVFDEANAILTEVCEDTFGEETVFTNAGDEEIATRVVFHSSTLAMGEGGPVLDPRPSAELPIGDIGRPNKGSFTYQGKTYALNGFITEDGSFGRWFVQEVG